MLHKFLYYVRSAQNIERYRDINLESVPSITRDTIKPATQCAYVEMMFLSSYGIAVS